MDTKNKITFIAIGSDLKNQVWVGHFGEAPQYLLYDFSGNLIEKRKNPYSLKDDLYKQHEGPERIIELLPECSVFIAQIYGNKSKRKLVENAGIQLITTREQDVQVAIDAFINNQHWQNQKRVEKSKEQINLLCYQGSRL